MNLFTREQKRRLFELGNLTKAHLYNVAINAGYDGPNLSDYIKQDFILKKRSLILQLKNYILKLDYLKVLLLKLRKIA